MRRVALVVVLLAAGLALSSCTPQAAKAATPVTPVAPKPVVIPAAPPPPPPPLSTPQTQVELPKPQPIDPAAMPAEAASPDPPPVTGRPMGPRRANNPPVIAPPVTPPVAAVEPTRGPLQEMTPAPELKRLQEQAAGRRREAVQILQNLDKRRLSRSRQNVVTSIRSFLASSEEAEKRNDMRQADALAERAQILARDLQNGK